MKTAIERLIEAVGYPERAPDGAVSFTMQVDGGEIAVAETAGGALRLSARVSDDASVLPRLAEYAAGRMLREDAVLAFGSLDDWKDGNAACAFLWLDVASGADAPALRRAFEDFADSRDWWRARVMQDVETGAAAPFPEMVIRP